MLFKNTYCGNERPKRARRVPLKYLDYSRVLVIRDHDLKETVDNMPRTDQKMSESGALKKTVKRRHNLSVNSDSEAVSRPQAKKRKLSNSDINTGIKARGYEGSQGKQATKKMRTLSSKKYKKANVKENKSQVSPYKKGSYRKDILANSDLSRGVKRKRDSDIENAVAQKKRRTASGVEKRLVRDTNIVLRGTSQTGDKAPIQRTMTPPQKLKKHLPYKVCVCGRNIEGKRVRLCNICKSDTVVQHLYPSACIKCCRIQLVSMDTVECTLKSEHKSEVSAIGKVAKKFLNPTVDIESLKDCFYTPQKGKQWLKKAKTQILYDKSDSTIKVKELTIASKSHSSTKIVGSKVSRKTSIPVKKISPSKHIASKSRSSTKIVGSKVSRKTSIPVKKISPSKNIASKSRGSSTKIIGSKVSRKTSTPVKKISKPKNTKGIFGNKLSFICSVCGKKFASNIKKLTHEFSHSRTLKVVVKKLTPNEVGSIITDSKSSDIVPKNIPGLDVDNQDKNSGCSAIEDKGIPVGEEKADAEHPTNVVEEGDTTETVSDSCFDHILTTESKLVISGTTDNSNTTLVLEENIEETDVTAIRPTVDEEECVINNNSDDLDTSGKGTNDTMAKLTQNNNNAIAVEEGNIEKSSIEKTEESTSNLLPDTSNEASSSKNISEDNTLDIMTNASVSHNLVDCKNATIASEPIDSKMVNIPTDICDISSVQCKESPSELTATEDITSLSPIEDVSISCPTLLEETCDVKETNTCDSTQIDVSNTSEFVTLNKTSVETESETNLVHTSSNIDSFDVNGGGFIQDTGLFDVKNEVLSSFTDEMSGLSKTNTDMAMNEVEHYEEENDDACEEIESDINSHETVSNEVICQNSSEADTKVIDTHANSINEFEMVNKTDSTNIADAVNGVDASGTFSTLDKNESDNATDILQSTGEENVNETSKTLPEVTTVIDTDDESKVTCQGDAIKCNSETDTMTVNESGTCNEHKQDVDYSMEGIKNSGDEDKTDVTEEIAIATSCDDSDRAIDNTNADNSIRIETGNANSEIVTSGIDTNISDTVCMTDMQDYVNTNDGSEIIGEAISVLAQDIDETSCSVNLVDASPEVSGSTVNNMDIVDEDRSSETVGELFTSGSESQGIVCSAETEMLAKNDQINTTQDINTCTNGVEDVLAETQKTDADPEISSTGIKKVETLPTIHESVLPS